MADPDDNRLTGNPATIARKLAEQRVASTDRPVEWNEWWNAMEAYCADPVAGDVK